MTIQRKSRLEKHGFVSVLIFVLSLCSASAADPVKPGSSAAPDSGSDIFSGIALGANRIWSGKSCAEGANPALPTGAICADCVKKSGLDATKFIQADRSAREIYLREIESRENEFFKDFVSDQVKQTGCEGSILNAMDARKSVRGTRAAAPSESTAVRNTRSGTLSDDERDALALQRTVADDVWGKLPVLNELQAAYEKIKVPSNPAAYANRMSPQQFAAARASWSAKFEAKQQAGARLQALYDSIWSGNDERMRGFLEKARKQVKAQNLTHDQFMLRALTDRGDFSLQNQVIEPMRSASVKRLADLRGYSSASWSEDPRRQPASERTLKRTLMETDAALDFMQRSPGYRADFQGMSCMMLGKYKDGPEIIYNTAHGVVFIATLGAGAWIEAINIAGKGVSVARALTLLRARPALMATLVGIPSADAYFTQHDVCGGVKSLVTSTTQGALCEAAAKDNGTALVSIFQQSVAERNCKSAVFLAAMGSAVPMGGGSSRVVEGALNEVVSFSHGASFFRNGKVVREAFRDAADGIEKVTVSFRDEAGRLATRNIARSQIQPAMKLAEGVKDSQKVAFQLADGTWVTGGVAGLDVEKGTARVIYAGPTGHAKYQNVKVEHLFDASVVRAIEDQAAAMRAMGKSRVDVLRVGEFASVPLESGGYANATILGHFTGNDGQKMVFVRLPNGYETNVLRSEIQPKLRISFDDVRIEHRVNIERSDGSWSTATVMSVDRKAGKVRVSFETPQGLAFKDVEVEKLRDAPVARPEPVTAAFRARIIEVKPKAPEPSLELLGESYKVVPSQSISRIPPDLYDKMQSGVKGMTPDDIHKADMVVAKIYGVSATDADGIKQAGRTMMKRFHPDEVNRQVIAALADPKYAKFTPEQLASVRQGIVEKARTESDYVAGLQNYLRRREQLLRDAEAAARSGQ